MRYLKIKMMLLGLIFIISVFLITLITWRYFNPDPGIVPFSYNFYFKNITFTSIDIAMSLDEDGPGLRFDTNVSYSADARVNKAFTISCRFLQNRPQNLEFFQNHPGVELMLEIPGMTVSPTDFVQAELDTTSGGYSCHWVVMAREPGEYLGYFKLKRTNRDRVEVFLPKTFEVVIKRKKWGWIDGMSSLEKILAGLVAITSLVAFYWNWKKEKHKNVQDED